MSTRQNSKTHESFLVLYRDLYQHASFLDETVVRMVHRRKVERSEMESHLAQMLAAITRSQEKHRSLRYTRSGRGKGGDAFHNDMVRVTKVVRMQVVILLKTSFLADKPNPGMDYITTLSDLTHNVQGAFQHVVRSNVLMPIMMN